MELDQLTGKIIECAMRVHSALGPGLLEGVYEVCLWHELTEAGLKAESQVWLPVIYKELEVPNSYKLDLLVESAVVVELKSIDAILAIHKAQLLSYLKLSGRPVGLLINFNVVHLRDGIHRMINRPQVASAGI